MILHCLDGPLAPLETLAPFLFVNDASGANGSSAVVHVVQVVQGCKISRFAKSWPIGDPRKIGKISQDGQNFGPKQRASFPSLVEVVVVVVVVIIIVRVP